ncbi:MAG: hypothetical protein IKS94_00240 [Prevotella sp.]|nr:hypothetical protein [Prevotella sp.]
METTDNILKHYDRFSLFTSSTDFKFRCYLTSNIGKQKEDLLKYSFIYDSCKKPISKEPPIEDYKIDINKYYINIKDVLDYLDSWEIPLNKYNNKMFKAIMIIKIILCIIFSMLFILASYYIFGRVIILYFVWLPLIYVFYKLWEKTSNYCVDVISRHIGLSSQYEPYWKVNAILLFIDEFNLAVLSYEIKENEWFRGIVLQPNGDLIHKRSQFSIKNH